jgi:hypothetical protein
MNISITHRREIPKYPTILILKSRTQKPDRWCRSSSRMRVAVSSRMNRFFLSMALTLCTCTAVRMNVQAAPIIYAFSGTGSGNFGSFIFTNASFTITASANTDGAGLAGFGAIALWTNQILSATVSVTGVGGGTFITPLMLENNPTNASSRFGIWPEGHLIPELVGESDV